MYLLMLLTAPASVLLLDKILSELSTEDVPEGGGWLSRTWIKGANAKRWKCNPLTN
jgi:hypothetical protein